MRDRVHRYRTELSWRGSTGGGYAAYDRTHRVTTAPGNVALTLSADRSFRGRPELPNPEQLLLAAASSCQLLSFRALAARDGIDVISCEDAAEALMPDDDKPVRITQITLRPRLVVPPRLASGCARCWCAPTMSASSPTASRPRSSSSRRSGIRTVRPSSISASEAGQPPPTSRR